MPNLRTYRVILESDYLNLHNHVKLRSISSTPRRSIDLSPIEYARNRIELHLSDLILFSSLVVKGLAVVEVEPAFSQRIGGCSDVDGQVEAGVVPSEEGTALDLVFQEEDGAAADEDVDGGTRGGAVVGVRVGGDARGLRGGLPWKGVGKVGEEVVPEQVWSPWEEELNAKDGG